MMKAIYSKATRACVWLGCTTLQIPPAFLLIHEIVANSGLTSTRKFSDTEKTESSYGNQDSVDAKQLSHHNSETGPALHAFFAAPWFNRLWVAQEVYGYDCTVFYGQHIIQWKDVVLTARLLLDLPTAGVAYRCPDNALWASRIDWAGTSADIFDLFRCFLCSDQRDKVYALSYFPPLCDLSPPIQPNTPQLSPMSSKKLLREFSVSLRAYIYSLALTTAQKLMNNGHLGY